MKYFSTIFLALVLGSVAVLGEAPDTCFARIKGPPRKVKWAVCDRKGAAPYPFEVEDITLGNILFHKGQQRTSLFTGYTVQLCIYGKMRGGQTPAKMQHSVHGKVSLIPGVVDLPVDFCAINTNGCAQTSPACGTPSDDNSLCVCTDVKVPDIPIDYDNVEVVWKLLDVANSNPPTNPGDCEKEFSEDTLRKQKAKETLACITIPAQVKKNPPQQFLDVQAEVQG